MFLCLFPATWKNTECDLQCAVSDAVHVQNSFDDTGSKKRRFVKREANLGWNVLQVNSKYFSRYHSAFLNIAFEITVANKKCLHGSMLECATICHSVRSVNNVNSHIHLKFKVKTSERKLN